MERTIDLACDLLDKKTDDIDLLFVGRFDADYPTPEIMEHAKQKLRNVNYWRCMRIGYGHPDGCSQLAYGAIQYIQDQRRANSAYLDIDCFLMLEADCVFTRKTWVEELQQAWQETVAAGKKICGAIQPNGRWVNVEEHVNAVALYEPDLLKTIPCLVGGPVTMGWDYVYRREMLPIARDTPLIKLDYKKPTITKEELFDQNPQVLIYHGCKDDTAIRHVREKYNL